MNDILWKFILLHRFLFRLFRNFSSRNREIWRKFRAKKAVGVLRVTSLFTYNINSKMATQKEVSLNGQEMVDSQSPLLKKTTSLVLPKDEHVKKKRKISFEAEPKPQLILENLGKTQRLSSSEESWNITSMSSPSRSPSPTKATNSLKTTLKKIKKEGRISFQRYFCLSRID